MRRDTFTVESPPPHQALLRDAVWLGRRNRMVHGMFEVDVTVPRRRIDAFEERSGESISFTAFLTTCLAEAIDRHKEIQPYRNWRNRHVVFDAVDVLLLIETSTGDTPVLTPHIIRTVNERSVIEIHDEIRAVQRDQREGDDAGFFSHFVSLPAPLRRLGYRLVKTFPRYWKRFGGTVAVTSVGMFGKAPGWGIPIANHTLEMTVGGITEKPRAVDEEIRVREVLNVTLSLDHTVVAGAPAARFAEEFRQLVEAGYGLDSLREVRP